MKFMPALFTRMSIGALAARRRSRKASIELGEAKSNSSRVGATIVMPRRESSAAIAAPIPRDAPVTNAVRSEDGDIVSTPPKLVDTL
jgi:hypothetical protein